MNTNANNNNSAKNRLERRIVRRPATCPVCNTKFKGDAVIVTGIRDSRFYIHAGCEGKALSGDALLPFNDNGNSAHYFKVVTHITAQSNDDRITWAVYLRSAGFNVRTVANNIKGFATVPAQSITKILQTVFAVAKSVDIDGKSFKTFAEANKYVNPITGGNSH